VEPRARAATAGRDTDAHAPDVQHMENAWSM
jgi:hypothetical protein